MTSQLILILQSKFAEYRTPHCVTQRRVNKCAGKGVKENGSWWRHKKSLMLKVWTNLMSNISWHCTVHLIQSVAQVLFFFTISLYCIVISDFSRRVTVNNFPKILIWLTWSTYQHSGNSIMLPQWGVLPASKLSLHRPLFDFKLNVFP